MSTQYAIASTVSGLTSLSAKLFAVNGDTVLYTADTVAERTNAKGDYLCTFGEVSVIPAGSYNLILFNAGGLSLSKGVRIFTGTDTEVAVGNAPQTGDSFARIGAAGAGLTALAPAATALSTAVWTAPPSGFLAATFPATLASPTNITSATGITVAANNDKSGYALTAGTGLGNQTADITGSLSGSVGSVTGAVGSVAGNVTGSVGSLAAQAKADVNAEILDVLQTDTFTELGAVPAATSSLKDKLTWLFMWFRNKSTETATQRKLFADDQTTVVSTETVSDDGTTFSKSEAA